MQLYLRENETLVEVFEYRKSYLMHVHDLSPVSSMIQLIIFYILKYYQNKHVGK